MRLSKFLTFVGLMFIGCSPVAESEDNGTEVHTIVSSLSAPTEGMHEMRVFGFHWGDHDFKAFFYIKIDQLISYYPSGNYYYDGCVLGTGIALKYWYCRWWGCRWEPAGENIYKEIAPITFDAIGAFGTRNLYIPGKSINNNKDLHQYIDRLPGACSDVAVSIRSYGKVGDPTWGSFPGGQWGGSIDWL